MLNSYFLYQNIPDTSFGELKYCKDNDKIVKYLSYKVSLGYDSKNKACLSGEADFTLRNKNSTHITACYKAKDLYYGDINFRKIGLVFILANGKLEIFTTQLKSLGKVINLLLEKNKEILKEIENLRSKATPKKKEDDLQLSLLTA